MKEEKGVGVKMAKRWQKVEVKTGRARLTPAQRQCQTQSRKSKTGYKVDRISIRF